MGIGIQGFFIIYNTLNYGVCIETVLDLSSIGLLFVALVLLCRFKKDQTAFRVGLATAIFICIGTAIFSTANMEDAILLFFVVPSALFFLLGMKESLIWVVPFLIISGFLCFFSEWFGKPPVSNTFILRFLAALCSFTGVSALAQHLRQRSLQDLLAADAALQNATVELKTIKGLVPICSYCRKILDEKGYWRQLEGFLKQHTNAHVSSGLCETCAAKKGAAKVNDGFSVPASLRPILEWKHTFERTRIKFAVYAGMIGAALLWGFIVRDFANGYHAEAMVQVVISILVMVVVWYQHRARHPWTGIAILVGLLFIQLVQSFFFPSSDASELSWLFLFPLIAAFLLGTRIATVTTLILFSVALWVLFSPHRFSMTNIGGGTRFFFSEAFIIVAILSINLERMRAINNRLLVKRLEALEKTYNNIKTIKGLVPVCRECKSIRNDDGFWTGFDRYFIEHSDVKFSHGICENCLKREAPEVYAEMQQEK